MRSSGSCHWMIKPFDTSFTVTFRGWPGFGPKEKHQKHFVCVVSLRVADDWSFVYVRNVCDKTNCKTKKKNKLRRQEKTGEERRKKNRKFIDYLIVCKFRWQKHLVKMYGRGWIWCKQFYIIYFCVKMAKKQRAKINIEKSSGMTMGITKLTYAIWNISFALQVHRVTFSNYICMLDLKSFYICATFIFRRCAT